MHKRLIVGGVKHTWTLLLCLALTGCSSTVPREIRQATPSTVAPHEVQRDSAQYLGEQVRWGGEILRLRNQPAYTDVEIYSRDLYQDGEPKQTGVDSVRFIARIRGFLDPAEFEPGQRMTVTGEVAGEVTHKVGEYPYHYPLVDTDVYHRWPKYTPPPDPVWYRYPYYYDPFWPYRPWRFGPYW